MSDTGFPDSRSDPDVSPSKATLESMPHEILVKIWVHLDDPSALASTSWKLRRASQASDLRARWLLAEFGPAYAVFRAVARPRLFNEEVCDVLVAYGANISLSLIPEFAKRHFYTGHTRALLKHEDQWGLKADFSTAMALMSEGEKRYWQHHLKDKFNEMDLFVSWLNDEKDLSPALLRTMFVDRQFAPLPLKGHSYEASLRSNRQGKPSAMQLIEKLGTVTQYLHVQQEYNAAKAKSLRAAATRDT